MNAAVLLGLASALGYGVTDFVTPVAGRALGVPRMMFHTQAVALALCSVWLLIALQGGGPEQRAPIEAWAAGLAAGVVVQLASGCLFQGLTHGSLAVVAPVAASYGAVTAVVGALSGEHLSVPTAVGIGIAVIGGALVAVPHRAERRSPLPPARTGSGLGWALAASFGYGVGFWLQGTFAVPALGSVVPVWLYYAVGVAGVGGLSWPLRLSLAVPEGRHRRIVLSVGVLSVGGNAAMTAGLATGQVAVVTVLSSLASAVTVLLARLVLRDRVAAHQWVGVAVLVIGLALINGFRGP